MMSCSSRGCINAENPVRILSAKPEWHKAQAKFIRSLCMEKERPSSSSSTSSTSLLLTKEGDKIFPFGSDATASGSPDSFVFRQKYLRSYQLTREDENGKSIAEKIKRWVEDKKKKKQKQKKLGKGKERWTRTSGSCVETWLKFLLCSVVEVQVV